MYLTKQRSLGPFMTNSFFDDAILRPFFASGGHVKWSTPPSVNIRREDHDYLIELAAPGYEKSDFTVKVENRQLVITGNRKEAETQAGRNFTRREFNYGNFSRSFELPEDTEHQAISAAYTNGILVVKVPKKVDQKIASETVVQVQ